MKKKEGNGKLKLELNVWPNFFRFIQFDRIDK